MWKSISDYLIGKKPNLIILTGFAVVVITGILGEIYSWWRLPFSTFFMILGILLCLCGFIMHTYCHRYHSKAHETSGKIKEVIRSGPFASIRHPMYLSLILIYFGLAIAWGIVWMFLPVLFFTLLIVIIAINEEEFLSRELGTQYENYKQSVPWRFIPKIF
jgi:protein-S-isoprenylcysteine O-methyltransferase Ste14